MASFDLLFDQFTRKTIEVRQQLSSPWLHISGIDCANHAVSLIGPVMGGVGKYCSCALADGCLGASSTGG